ncbi:MAG: hypothetical protein KKE39_04430 [Bacteroidetes bacterium]|nr:hypothetical protein [Bacteroidota bacterium]MBU1372444.1 hypothetical protein [Bacteroidota bacterium]MBU1483468.1 hypothetical protein [Bacteroidota bacterium]MBU1761011.1 hypothetical protein [Bacteroidota bacterium]MBU2269186.1 hypothetical protein [Bacteroidota bacterium]
MIKPKIENLEQLRSEIAILKLKKAEDEIYFNQSFQKVKNVVETPTRWFNNVLSFLGLNSESEKGKVKADWITSVGRIALPFLLNKTVLRGRGFFVRALVSLISQKSINSKNFNKNVLSHWVDNLTEWIESSVKDKKKSKNIDYGIPPESETY